MTTVIEIYDRGRYDYLIVHFLDGRTIIDYHYPDGDFAETISAVKDDALKLARAILDYYGEKQ